MLTRIFSSPCLHFGVFRNLRLWCVITLTAAGQYQVGAHVHCHCWLFHTSRFDHLRYLQRLTYIKNNSYCDKSPVPRRTHSLVTPTNAAGQSSPTERHCLLFSLFECSALFAALRSFTATMFCERIIMPSLSVGSPFFVSPISLTAPSPLSLIRVVRSNTFA